MLELFFRKLEARDSLPREEREVLREIVRGPRQVAAGAEIVRQGSDPGESTLLLAGLAGRSVTLPNGTRQFTSLNIPGDFVDLHSFLLRRMDHGIVALGPCSIAKCSHASLREATSRYPHLTRSLWLDTLVDGAIHRQWVVSMGRRDTLGRLAHLACEHYVRLEAVGLAAAGRFDFPASQAQIGDVLGVSTVHVNRTLQELRASGVVTWERSQVTIHDWNRLAGMAGFDPGYLQLAPTPV